MDIIDKTNLKNLGFEIIAEEKLDSTNKNLKSLADKGQQDRTIVIAKEQARGRGRLGRAWESPKGGLWFSLLFRPNLPMGELSLITLTMAAAVREGIYSYTGLDIKIKWPNDILYNGKKLVGILTEVKGDMDRVDYLVVGIGINVNNPIPQELREKAISLKEVLGQEILLSKLLLVIMEKIDKHYKDFVQGKTSEILEINRKHSAIIGRQVEVMGVNGGEKGIVQDIKEDGSLVIKTNDGIKRVMSGDVSLCSFY